MPAPSLSMVMQEGPHSGRQRALVWSVRKASPWMFWKRSQRHVTRNLSNSSGENGWQVAAKARRDRAGIIVRPASRFVTSLRKPKSVNRRLVKWRVQMLWMSLRDRHSAFHDLVCLPKQPCDL